MTQLELDELYLAGLELDKAGDHDGALALFRRGADEGDASAYNALGIAYDGGRGVEQDKRVAIEWFVKAWNDGENPEYGANIAKTYEELDEWEGAEPWWRRALESGDKGAGLEYAKSLMERGQPVAYARLTRLIADAANAEPRMEVSENEKHEAQALLRDLRRNRVSGSDDYTRDDQMLQAGGPLAQSYFQETLRNDADNVRAHFNLMLLAINRASENAGKDQLIPMALRHARAVARLSPGALDLHLNLGRIYALAGTYDLAIAHFKRELARQPDDDYTLFCLGEIYFARHEWNKAEFYLRRVRGAIEWEMEALRKLGQLYCRTGDLKRERAVCDRMLEHNPHDELALQNIGAIYLDMRDYARALEYSERAKIEDPHNPAIHRNIRRARRGLAKQSVASE